MNASIGQCDNEGKGTAEMATATCLITKADRRRLGSLLTSREGRAFGALQTIGELESLLEDACAVDSKDVPEMLITMNSTVRVIGVDSGVQRTVTLVYPRESDPSAEAVSVTDPLGVALLGRRIGDVLQSPDDAIREDLRVTEVLFQPERAGRR
jgi:regulator of nucleoside diphosphate kinase